MQTALDLLYHNVRRARDLVAVFRAVDARTTDALDVTDILRAALVMSVSALDHFIHEVVRIGMLECCRAKRPYTASFARFQVTLEGALRVSAAADSEPWLDSEIRERHGYQSFQKPDRIADAIRLVSDITLWIEVASKLGLDRREVTERLTLIVQRRDKIAHEADIMPDYAGETVYSDVRSPIDERMVADAIDFIERLSEAIYDLVSLIPSTT